jgi:hypothetical protein
VDELAAAITVTSRAAEAAAATKQKERSRSYRCPTVCSNFHQSVSPIAPTEVALNPVVTMSLASDVEDRAMAASWGNSKFNRSSNDSMVTTLQKMTVDNAKAISPEDPIYKWCKDIFLTFLVSDSDGSKDKRMFLKSMPAFQCLSSRITGEVLKEENLQSNLELLKNMTQRDAKDAVVQNKTLYAWCQICNHLNPTEHGTLLQTLHNIPAFRVIVGETDTHGQEAQASEVNKESSEVKSGAHLFEGKNGTTNSDKGTGMEGRQEGNSMAVVTPIPLGGSMKAHVQSEIRPGLSTGSRNAEQERKCPPASQMLPGSLDATASDATDVNGRAAGINDSPPQPSRTERDRLFKGNGSNDWEGHDRYEHEQSLDGSGATHGATQKDKPDVTSSSVSHMGSPTKLQNGQQQQHTAGHLAQQGFHEVIQKEENGGSSEHVHSRDNDATLHEFDGLDLDKEDGLFLDETFDLRMLSEGIPGALPPIETEAVPAAAAENMPAARGKPNSIAAYAAILNVNKNEGKKNKRGKKNAKRPTAKNTKATKHKTPVATTPVVATRQRTSYAARSLRARGKSKTLEMLAGKFSPSPAKSASKTSMPVDKPTPETSTPIDEPEPEPELEPVSKTSQPYSYKRIPSKFLNNPTVLVENMRLAAKGDQKNLNSLHCFVRKELLEVFVLDAEKNDGHNRVGLRCVYCGCLPKEQRDGVSMSSFFPKSVEDLYRAVCTWQRIHFKACGHIPDDMKETYWRLKDADRTRGKKAHWVSSAKAMGFRNVDKDRSGMVWCPTIVGNGDSSQGDENDSDEDDVIVDESQSEPETDYKHQTYGKASIIKGDSQGFGDDVDVMDVVETKLEHDSPLANDLSLIHFESDVAMDELKPESKHEHE